MANDVNNNGWVVGWRKDSNGFKRAYLWEQDSEAGGGQFTDLGTLYWYGGAEAVSEEGHIVGTNVTMSLGELGFRWTQSSGMVDLGDYDEGNFSPTSGVNDLGIVAATVKDGNGSQLAARWTGSGWDVKSDLGFNFGVGADVSNDGSLFGNYIVNDPGDPDHGKCYPVVWTDGSVQTLGSTAWQQCGIRGVNESKQAVGWVIDDTGIKHPIIATSSEVRTLATLGGDGEAYDINELGWIVGSVKVGSQTAAALWVSDTSEPILLGELEFGDDSQAKGLNDKGFIVGSSDEKFGDGWATLWIVSGDPGGGTPSTIEELKTAVADLVGDGVLDEGQANSLLSKLDAAQEKIDAEQNQTAANILAAFINEVEAFQQAGILSEDEAGPLIEGAQGIIDELVGDG